MKKILIYNHTFFNRSETFIYNQVKALKNENKLTLVGHQFELSDSYVHDKQTKTFLIPVVPLSILERIQHFFKRNFTNYSSRLPPQAEKEMNGIISSENIEIIHAHFGTAALRILPIAIKNKIPLVVSFHGYDASRMLHNKRYTQQLQHLFTYATKNILCAAFMFNNLKKYGL